MFLLKETAVFAVLFFFSDMETYRSLFNSLYNVDLAGTATPENRIVNMLRIFLHNFSFAYFSTIKTVCVYIVFTTKVTNNGLRLTRRVMKLDCYEILLTCE
jgi:hypothetical protein